MGLLYRVDSGARAPLMCFGGRKSFSPSSCCTAPCTTLVHCAHTHMLPMCIPTQCFVQHNHEHHVGAEPTYPKEGLLQPWVQATPAVCALWEALLWTKWLERITQAVGDKLRCQPMQDSHHASRAGHKRRKFPNTVTELTAKLLGSGTRVLA